jgi:transposase, IS30 family
LQHLISRLSYSDMKKKNQPKGKSPLTLRERTIIEVGWCRDNWTITAIAEELDRNKSSVSRELAGRPRRGLGKYNADVMHRKALDRIAKRGNTPKVVRVTGLKAYIEEKLKLGWSPEQISLRLPVEYKQDHTMRISYEAIYQEVYRRVHRGGNGAVKKGQKDLRPFLARRHKRRAKKGFRKAQKLERDAKLPSIEERPVVVSSRKQLGHWEDDTVVSRQSLERLKTINERVSGVILIGKMKDGSITESNRVVLERLGGIPQTYRKTLTRDRGSENLGWEEIEKVLDTRVYFAHAYSSWERGSNENGNGLIRRVYPKKTDFALVSEEALHTLEHRLNTRPRRRLGGFTPEEVFFKATGVALYS